MNGLDARGDAHRVSYPERGIIFFLPHIHSLVVARHGPATAQETERRSSKASGSEGARAAAICFITMISPIPLSPMSPLSKTQSV